MQNLKFGKRSNQFIELVALFERSNYASERDLKENFTKEIDDFLRPWKITASKCDIFEHILLQLAGCTYKPNSSHFNVHTSDLGIRIWFDHQEDTDQDAEKLLHFFHDSGDASALILAKSQARDTHAENERFIQFMMSEEASTLTYEQMRRQLHSKREKFGYLNPADGIKIKSSLAKPAYLTEGTQPIRYIFSVDAKIVRELIWPKMKNHIEHLTLHEPHVLGSYQQQCASYFDEKKKNQLMQNQTPLVLESSITAQENPPTADTMKSIPIIAEEPSAESLKNDKDLSTSNAHYNQHSFFVTHIQKGEKATVLEEKKQFSATLN